MKRNTGYGAIGFAFPGAVKPAPDSTQLEEGDNMNTKEMGRQVMQELMGAKYIEDKDKKRNAFNSVIHDYSEEVCFGRVWARKGIDRKLRSILNVAMLTALNRPAQLRNHLDGALNNGCTVDELQEILLQAAVYCGLPAAVDAFRIAEEVLRARKLLD
jgi:4-carboxymuconolactone decarboxylase